MSGWSNGLLSEQCHRSQNKWTSSIKIRKLYRNINKNFQYKKFFIDLCLTKNEYPFHFPDVYIFVLKRHQIDCRIVFLSATQLVIPSISNPKQNHEPWNVSRLTTSFGSTPLLALLHHSTQHPMTLNPEQQTTNQPKKSMPSSTRIFVINYAQRLPKMLGATARTWRLSL